MMMASSVPVWVSFLGYLAGACGIAIAIYFQFFVEERTPAIHVTMFFGIGLVSFLLAVRARHVGPEVTVAFRAFGFLGILILECIGFMEIVVYQSRHLFATPDP